jgi:nicotinamidase-related amidase
MNSPRDPHGCVPEKSETVLLLIDVINPFDFPGSEKLLPAARQATLRLAALKTRLAKRGLPAIYVNDNFGRWRSDFRRQVEDCISNTAGGEIAKLLLPREQDYFVLKPKHSGFYSTSLEVLLRYLGATTLILTGFAGNICVLQTANDAYMRDFRLIIPRDCVASESIATNRAALRHAARFLKADTRPSSSLRFPKKVAQYHLRA